MAARLSGRAGHATTEVAPSLPPPSSLAHPIFAALRRPLEQLAAEGAWPDAARLNALAIELGYAPHNALGMPIRFVAPEAESPSYELQIHASGRVPTRPGNLHDLFNALAWLVFPRLKAALNALHAREIPHEAGRRGRFRDLLTLIDEGGALVACADDSLAALVREQRWKELFWDRRARIARDMRIVVVGHAVLEKALAPWPGVSCKAVFFALDRAQLDAPAVELAAQLDARAAAWLTGLPREATPRDLPPLPVFGYPGWLPGSDRPEFYDDERYFRPLRRVSPEACAPPDAC